MRILGDDARLIWSASDLKAAAECEFAWLRAIDAKLGRCAPVDGPADAMLERAAALGDAHEARTLSGYREAHGDAVVEIERVSSADSAALADAAERTTRALRDPGVRVLFQAAFSADDFVGFADFLVRDGDERWRVQDTKLARTARSTALMQLAAYVDQLDAQGVPRSNEVDLLLGDGATSTHAADDLLPLFDVRRDRLRALVEDRQIAVGADLDAVAWGDDRGALQLRACGRCAACDEQAQVHRDVLLVAGMRPTQRERLRAAGLATIDALADAEAAPERMNAETFDRMRTQARLQVATERQGGAEPLYEVVDPTGFGAMPRPDAGDIFFDFEGDPLHSEQRAAGAVVWGLDYLFGWVDIHEQYTALWAHDLAAERRALERFCDVIVAQRRAHPGMHIYHYAPYEPSHLAAMAARHGVREADVDRMLRDELFVDLYPIVKNTLRVGSRSYSIKKLEPLYMGAEGRTQDVQKGDDSIVRYVEARGLVDAGRADEGQAILDDLAEYNRYDCVSTRRLRDWLVERARESGAVPARPDDDGGVAYAPSARATALVARADELRADADPADPLSDDEAALRLAAAAIDYYPREAKTFWQAHFSRLREPVSLWAETRDVVVTDAPRSVVRDDWHRPEGARVERRRIELRGAPGPGTRLPARSQPFALYAAPAPFPATTSSRWIHVAHPVTVVEELEDGAIVEERSVDGETWDELPIALTPASPPSAGAQQRAIDEWADSVLDAGDAFPVESATDLLRRIRADHHAGAIVEPTPGREVDAIVRSLVSVPTYLAVQGPPGTGKTYVGSHVIARLVNEHGWRVGVVAQSHAVVENLLDRVVVAGVAPERVGKALKDDTRQVRFTAVRKQQLAAFQREANGGVVVGGTAWDLAHPGRVARHSLDLLVVDEAGQFSLASTIAVAQSTRRLLLLGDPQQLPQVSQGTHPAPVDTSALGWLMGEASVLPSGHGAFLAQTWRLHPALAAAVSELSYGGRLRARPGAELRTVAGVEPGVHPVPVVHRGNATESTEEADEVVRLVRDVVGREYVDISIDEGQRASPVAPRPLTQHDVIVVAPYNAQQRRVENALIDAGFAEVRVGTVDRFQGQEAAVAILTLAASSGRDAPRGPEFLLLQNRLNVGISRAKVAAFLVYSPGLIDDLPHHGDAVARLSAFVRLTRARGGYAVVP